MTFRTPHVCISAYLPACSACPFFGGDPAIDEATAPLRVYSILIVIMIDSFWVSETGAIDIGAMQYLAAG